MSKNYLICLFFTSIFVASSVFAMHFGPCTAPHHCFVTRLNNHRNGGWIWLKFRDLAKEAQQDLEFGDSSWAFDKKNYIKGYKQEYDEALAIIKKYGVLPDENFFDLNCQKVAELHAYANQLVATNSLLMALLKNEKQ